MFQDVVDISVRNPVKVVCEEKYTTYEISVQVGTPLNSFPSWHQSGLVSKVALSVGLMV